MTLETAAATSPPLHTGVNYLTLYNQYATPDARLQNDFARFQSNGINTIVISLYWYRVELSYGKYDKSFIKNVIHVINVANTYGLSVMIDFHTLIGDTDAWSNPSYVGVGMNLLTNATIRNGYIAMVKWAVKQLKGISNIWAYSVVNEPWYWPLTTQNKTTWVNLIDALSIGVKGIDKKPVTVRFIGALFIRDWAWNKSLLNWLDFISINGYLCDTCTDSIYWTTWTKYQNGLKYITGNATTYNKAVQITEFGYGTSNDTLQASMYCQYLTVFKASTNLTGWLAWGWDSSYDPNNPSWNAIGTYAIDIPAADIPRPAYSILT